MRLAAAFVSLATLLPVAASPAPLAPAAEVEWLLTVLGGSDCRFYRNGDWHDAKEAQAHLRNKYEYLAKRKLIRSTEDFISGAGEKSSLSGQPYKVQCANQPPAPSGAWLRERLAEMRRSRPDATP